MWLGDYGCRLLGKTTSDITADTQIIGDDTHGITVNIQDVGRIYSISRLEQMFGPAGGGIYRAMNDSS
jgi:hypothetical protein